MKAGKREKKGKKKKKGEAASSAVDAGCSYYHVNESDSASSSGCALPACLSSTARHHIAAAPGNYEFNHFRPRVTVLKHANM